MIEPPITGDWPAPGETAPGPRPVIPRYEILDELGRGGMGVVYRARQMDFQREVALKVMLDAALAGPRERARFRIEAEAAARMSHPNIVPIFEVNEHEGRLYFTMEFVEGGSLDKHLVGQAWPAVNAARLVHSLALAVQHAHAQRIVHRDLKPANILLSLSHASTDRALARGSPLNDAIPKITDFGLAKRLDSESTALTQDGVVLGTACYMAPEQAAGRVQDINQAVDIYALGAILYELLTGNPPFQGDSWNKTIDQVIHAEPMLPTRVCPDVPRDLETVCLKCLEKEPGNRYASAQALADDLSRFLEGHSVAAVPVAPRERLARLAAQDGYQLQAEVGRGPRSVVYRALSAPLQQPVALKVFRAGICKQEEWESRIRQAAVLWAASAHPHILAAHRHGWWDGAPYLAVEYVPQGSLISRQADRPMSVYQALRLAEQLTETVSYLHRQGIVHGNLKPSNVLLAADGIPRIVDFRLTGGWFFGPSSESEYQFSDLVYLAPEYLRDPSLEPNPHVDIYGIGALLYQMLTGRPPYSALSGKELREQIRSQDPTALSQLNPDVDESLDAFCQRCLRKNPWRRFHRAYDVLTRLRHFQEQLIGQTEPWPRKRPSM
ncbi:MAG TPA: serine/threonine-protein kinase [Gemmataceae bacterium]|nr:serine/threonine-protein kinase [Gemmataceae bacterium]